MRIPGDRPGTVSPSTDEPFVGEPITVSVEDPNGGVSDVLVDWEVSPDKSDPWTQWSTFNELTVTPPDEWDGLYLRVKARYNDGFDEQGKETPWHVFAHPVVDRRVPKFDPDATVADQSYTVGTAIPELTLPEATLGNGERVYFVLAPDGKDILHNNGLRLDKTTRVLSGTPTVSHPATTYTYTVGDSDQDTGASDSDAIPFDIAIAPAPPVISRVGGGDQELTLTVRRPSEDTGIDGYSVQISEDGGATWGGATFRHQFQQQSESGKYSAWTDIPASAPGEANATSYTVTGLDNGAEYTFQVRAVNGRGVGEASGEASATTGTTPPLPGPDPNGVPTVSVARDPCTVVPGGQGASASADADVAVEGTTVGTEDPGIPDRIALMQNYPNPFNPSTTIEYMLPEPGHVRLAVYDLAGREIRTVVDKVHAPGAYSVRFDAQDIPSGKYLYRLESNGKVITNGMVLVK